MQRHQMVHAHVTCECFVNLDAHHSQLLREMEEK
jgi:hypothetical protein